MKTLDDASAFDLAIPTTSSRTSRSAGSDRLSANVSSIDDNKRTVLRYFEPPTRNDVAGLMAIYDESMTLHVSGNTLTSGSYSKTQLAELAGRVVDVFPTGLTLKVTGMVAEGDRVAAEVESRYPRVGQAVPEQLPFSDQLGAAGARRTRPVCGGSPGAVSFAAGRGRRPAEDPRLRENFIERVFAFRRLKDHLQRTVDECVACRISHGAQDVAAVAFDDGVPEARETRGPRERASASRNARAYEQLFMATLARICRRAHGIPTC